MRTRFLTFSVLLVLSASILAGCGGGSDGGEGVDTGLGFNAAVDESAAPQEQLKQYVAAIFDQVQLEPGLESCAKANAGKADPAELTKIEGLSGEDQEAANQAFQASFFHGCTLDSGKIMEDGANDETKRLVAFTVRDELKATLASRSDDYTNCISEGLDAMSDEDLLALIQDPGKATDLGTKITEGCGSAAPGTG
jgi:hypothetical protein